MRTSSNTNSSDYFGSRIFALGDLNGDKQNDLVTVSDDQKSFQPYYYDEKTYKFSPSPSATAVPAGYTITSIFIGKD